MAYRFRLHRAQVVSQGGEREQLKVAHFGCTPGPPDGKAERRDAHLGMQKHRLKGFALAKLLGGNTE